MKRTIFMKSLVVSALCALVLAFVSCADVNGLHNQRAAKVTFKFVNFPASDGAYAIPGEHNKWDNTKELITIKGGEGTSSTVSITTTSLEFSLTKKDSWLRPWSKTDGGTIDGEGRPGPDIKRNFLVEGLDLSSDITITVDGSTPVAKVTVK